jgi:predicted outer membrane repeat protein
VTVNNSTFFGNSATGNRYVSGGGIDSSGTLTISNSTFTGNTVWGISSAKGGGISISQGSAAINNSTLSGNGACPYQNPVGQPPEVLYNLNPAHSQP